ncbi:MAG TPA: Wzy polymerase domain-containing protein [Burkholderiales bacterium]|nr:Wzy polymerase domain-containing protein [Burkholderiales bacterium]
MAALERLTPAHFGLAAVGLAWTLPFLQPYHRLPLTSFYSEWLALAAGLLALAPLLERSWWRQARVPWAALPVLGFIALLAAHYALGRVAYGGQVLTAALYLLWAVLLMAFAATLVRMHGLPGAVSALAWCLVAGGVLSALAALAQHYQIAAGIEWLVARKNTPAAYGNIAQYNHFAAYGCLGLASLAYLYASGRLHAAWAAAAGALLLFAVTLSGSRSVLLYLFVLLALALFQAWRAGWRQRRLPACVAALAAGFLAAQWLADLPAVSPPAETETVKHRLLAGEQSASAINIGHRVQLAREAWAVFLQAPLLGAGWGQFAWHDFEQRSAAGAGIGTWPFNHAHNLVLHLLAETGLAGALLIAGAALAWLWGLRRAGLDLERWWLIALLGVIGAHSMLEHPLWYAYFLGIAAVALGLSSGDGVPAPLGRAGPAFTMLALAAGAAALFFVLDGYRGFERVFAAGNPPPRPEVAAALSRAHRNPILRPYAELYIASGMDLEVERVRERLELNARVMRFAPIAGVAYRHALLLALAGERSRAERQLERAARVYPDELPTTIALARAIAERHPVEMTPLLELAAAELARRRAERGGR